MTPFICLNASSEFRLSSVIQPVNQIHSHFNDSVFFIGLTLGNQERQSYQSVVSQTLATVGAIEDTIHAQEVDENGGGNPLVAVAESMIFHNEV
jgi:hypothetical protein